MERSEFIDFVDGVTVEYEGSEFAAALVREIAGQLRAERPPQVWATTQRLLQAGMSPEQVLAQLHLAHDATADDAAGYPAALERLPMPAAADVLDRIVEIVRELQPIPVESVDALVVARTGMSPDDPLTIALLDRVGDMGLEDGRLALLHPDQLVEIRSFTAGAVFTHRVTEHEDRFQALRAADLAGFGRGELSWCGEDAVAYAGGDNCLRWLGPDGWAELWADGDLLAVRVDAAGEVGFEVLDKEPAVSPGLVAAVRRVYDQQVAESGLPIAAQDLALEVLAADPSVFESPQAPLMDLAEAAGLEQRGDLFAHDESVWRRNRFVEAQNEMYFRFGVGDKARAAAQVLDLLEAGVPETADARDVLYELYEPDLVQAVSEALLGTEDDPERLAEFGQIARRLLAAASKPAEVAVANWFEALACERRGEVLDAESALRAADRADPSWSIVQDRLAWYEADRGDAAAALARWRRLDATSSNSPDVAVIEPLAVTADVGRLGRNEPCWCGSGRKYKACHLGKPVSPPLPDRVDWLYRKACGYLERRGGAVGPVIRDHAEVRAGFDDDDEALMDALDDPLVVDVVLHESGWFARFLADRGPLLPADELELAQSWALVERSVYEVLDVSAGTVMTVRDARSGKTIEVKERVLSDCASGIRLCGRAVPDGELHVFVGGLFETDPGTGSDVLELLDRGDPFEFLSYRAELDLEPAAE